MKQPHELPEFRRHPAPDAAKHWIGDQWLAVRRVSQGGEPAVMIHGLGGTSLNWTDVAYGLEGRLDSWAVDLPGFGESPRPVDGDYSPATYANSIKRLVDSQIGEKVHVFGNSLGGAVALQFAGRYPELVRSTTLISPSLPRSANFSLSLQGLTLPIALLPGVGDRFMQWYMRLPPADRVRRTYEHVFADVANASAVRIDEAVTAQRYRDELGYATEVFVSALRALVRNHLERGPERPYRLAARIDSPTLLIYGHHDNLVDPRSVHRAAQEIPKARAVLLPESGHVAQMEHPELVIELWDALIGSRVGRALDDDDPVAHISRRS
ncbi:MAG: alpha/beta hydrolase [Actinobacteria bacterium]|nr:alpha/beta hydrolase [Actinomycetota bacterium]